MRQTIVRAVTAAGLAAGATAVVAPPALAHETRAARGIHMVVGWGDEPAYTGFKNSVELALTDARGDPLTRIGDDLRVEVVYGDASTTLDVAPNFAVGAFGEPGDYRAWLTPTRAGDYTFRFTGTIAGTKIDETFSSGPDAFSPVLKVSSIQFPAKDPSTGEIAARIERESARLRAALRTAEAANDDVETARGLAMAALGTAAVALLGLAFAGVRALKPTR